MRSKLLTKRGYGRDQSGEVLDQQQPNIEDSSEPWTQHETPHNPTALAIDAEAEKDFPSLAKRPQRYPGRRAAEIRRQIEKTKQIIEQGATVPGKQFRP